jgi:glycosidase
MCRLKTHFQQYPANFQLILFLDNHDTNRFMFYCHNDRSILDEAIAFTRELPFASSYYYATELYYTNSESVFGGTPYADDQVRTPYEWDEDDEE